MKMSKALVICIIFIFLICVFCNACIKNEKDSVENYKITENIRKVAKDNPTINLGDYLPFKWDIAYYDSQIGEKSDDLKNIYNSKYKFRKILELDKPYVKRLIFLNNGEVVYDYVFRDADDIGFRIDETTPGDSDQVFYFNSDLFKVQWIKITSYFYGKEIVEEKLYLIHIND